MTDFDKAGHITLIGSTLKYEAVPVLIMSLMILLPVVEAFALSTGWRAHQRQEFERLANEKEALRMQMEEQQRQEVEQREKDDITKMRNDQVPAK